MVGGERKEAVRVWLVGLPENRVVAEEAGEDHVGDVVGESPTEMGPWLVHGGPEGGY